MKSFYINPETGDLEFDGSNNFKMAEGDEELLQCVRIIITTNVNEWFLNPDHGFDWSATRGKNVDPDVFIERLYAAILQENRIASIDDLKFDFDAAKRKIKVSFSFTKIDGEQLEGSIAA